MAVSKTTVPPFAVLAGAVWALAGGWLGALEKAAVFAAAGLWCAYQFFVLFDPPRDGTDDKN